MRVRIVVMLEILALCSCASFVCLWCATTLGIDQRSTSHCKRHRRFNRSSSCPAKRNSPYKKNPKCCQDASCSLNRAYVCCKCNKRSRKLLRRNQNCYTTARNASNFSKPYPIVYSCSDPGAQNTVLLKSTKSKTTSYAPPPTTSLPAMCKNIGATSAPFSNQYSKHSRSKMHEVSNNEQSMNFWLNSPEDISYNISQDPFFKSLEPINGVLPESVPRPVYCVPRPPCANYYKSINSWSPRYSKPVSNFSTTFAGAPLYKLICKTCQMDKHKCICANFWCNPIIRAGYPQFLGSNFSFPSDSPEFSTSKASLPNCAPIVLNPWSTVRLPPTSDLQGTNVKNTKSRKILCSAYKRQKSGK